MTALQYAREVLDDIVYLRKRGFAVERAGDEVRVGKNLLSLDQVRAMAARERELDNGVEPAGPTESTRRPSPDAAPAVIPSQTLAQQAAPARDLSAASAERKIPRSARDDREARDDSADRGGRRARADRDLSEEIIQLAVMRLGDVEDIREALIAQAVGCVHAAGMLVAALPEAASRAAVVRELKRFLPESAEQSAGELRPRGG